MMILRVKHTDTFFFFFFWGGGGGGGGGGGAHKYFPFTLNILST